MPLLLGEAPSRAGDRYYHFPLLREAMSMTVSEAA